MASTNKAEAYQTENVFKCKAGDASSLGCCGCDAGAYAQANCWRAFYPPFPRCQACLGKWEDYALQQPRFFNHYFPQPLFYNTSAFPKHCCPHEDLNIKPESKPSTRTQGNHDCDRIRELDTSSMFCKKMENKIKGDKINERNISESRSSHMPQSQNQKREHQRNGLCSSCGESFWSSSPFIIPVVSYCVLWNPQNSRNNCSNYVCGHTEDLDNENEDPINTKSNENYDGSLEVLNKCDQDVLEDDMLKIKTDKEHNQRSSCFLSTHSSSRDESKNYSIKKQSSSISNDTDSEDNSEEEETGEQIVESESSGNAQNHLSTESSKNFYSNTVEYCDVYSTENENQQLSSEESEIDLKAEDLSAEAEVKEEADEILPKNSQTSFHGKNEEFNSVRIGSCDGKSKPTSKNLIKSFTVTSRTENPFEGKSKVLGAGGDLGGDNCTGFKVNIESEVQPECMQQGILKRNFETKRSLLKGFEGRNAGTEKAIRNSKTGIAKLIQDSKPRGTNLGITKDIKRENKECDSYDKKRRCFSNDSHTGGDNSKFLKDKSIKMARRLKTGPEEENSSLSLSNKSYKREEKFSVPKVRSHNCEWGSRK